MTQISLVSLSLAILIAHHPNYSSSLPPIYDAHTQLIILFFFLIKTFTGILSFNLKYQFVSQPYFTLLISYPSFKTLNVSTFKKCLTKVEYTRLVRRS